MWQGEDSKLTVCTLKKQALWSPISMPFAMKGYQSSNNKNTHITWGYGLFNGDETKKTWCLKRSVQVSTTVKKTDTFLNIVHQSNLITKIASKKLLLSSATWWFVITPTFPHLYSDISGSFSSSPSPNPPKTHENRQCPMMPFFIYYSMFGFQRVGDIIWQANGFGIHFFRPFFLNMKWDVGEGGRRAAQSNGLNA